MRTLALDYLHKLPKFHFKWKFSIDMKPVYRNAIHGWAKLVYRPQYLGFKNIPPDGPAIIICNHVSYVDGPIIDAGVYSLCKRHVRYLIDEDIFKLPIVNHIMTLDRAIPIAVNRKSVEKAFDEIAAGLDAGDIICIFPEGFLTFTGGLGRFRPGIEWITRRSSTVPVIPMALSGLWGSVFSRKYMKAAFRWLPRQLRRPKVTVMCGEAIPADKINVNYLQEIVLRLKYSING
jgi:1-acyl-sn-glycerol-3-phosphate acyltransferase